MLGLAATDGLSSFPILKREKNGGPCGVSIGHANAFIGRLKDNDCDHWKMNTLIMHETLHSFQVNIVFSATRLRNSGV